MHNTEHKSHHHNHCTPVSPRISFSNDFVDAQIATNKTKEEGSSRSEAPAVVSSNFEFSVTNYSMMSADELFFKGRLLPFKGNCNNRAQRASTTLKEELLLDDDDDFQDFSQRQPKGFSTKWKGFLGLRKSQHLGSKKVDQYEGSSDSDMGVETRFCLFNEGTRLNNMNSQELLNEGGSNCGDVEIEL
ncbi:hypothetical protein RJT34_30710 [Clitoria ternatea]|uniref:Uncharacterized protein n=1 Tax=Clitoria ternatea TaxID=43366 RepID=A0AAN9I4B0_CLITE